MSAGSAVHVGRGKAIGQPVRLALPCRMCLLPPSSSADPAMSPPPPPPPVKGVYEKEGKSLPNDPYEQMRLAINAVFGSWNTPRAVKYRCAWRAQSSLPQGPHCHAQPALALQQHCCSSGSHLQVAADPTPASLSASAARSTASAACWAPP